jgi:hypothetical protein
MPEHQHKASADFWHAYDELPQEIRDRADKQFALLVADPQHPSLQFKKLGDRHGNEIWSARVTLNYRAIALKRSAGFLWFWIGDHKTYDSLIT